MSKEQLTCNKTLVDGEYDNSNDNYDELLVAVRNRFNSVIEKGGKLFTTNAEGLYEAYLNGLPEEARQHYTCRACEQFIARFGGLVTINEAGAIKSAVWTIDVPDFFIKSVKAMIDIVLKSKVNGVFVSEVKTLGTPVTGEWTHFSAVLPKEMVLKVKLQNADQVMAEKREDFRILLDGLREYNVDTVAQAVTLLKTESLYRSEKCLGVAEWLKELHDRRNNTKNDDIRKNLVWLAVATAPTGYCHVKSSMIGTLLDDIASGMDFESVSHKFADKMNPTKYQRPQAAPTAGNVARAEEIFKKLGLEGALDRRFARIDEIKKIWEPKEIKAAPQGSGIFSHVEVKGAKKETPKMDMPAVTMTWEKFSKTVLPLAESIEFLVKGGNDNYSAILTAVDPEAAPILQWDTEEERNPFSWYVYNRGSHYSKWGLNTGYCKVTAVSLQPSMWNGDFKHQSKSVMFVLDGAKDDRSGNTGNALFPETLKAELREVRATIEAYSNTATIAGYDEASACGIRLQAGTNWDATFRVTTNTGVAVYKLDRWD